MFYRVRCQSTLWTNIYASGEAGLVSVRELTVSRTQLGEGGMDRL